MSAAVKDFFATELLNRIDDVIEFVPLTFVPLTIDAATDIGDGGINRINAAMARRAVQLSVSAAARQLLVDNGFDRQFGARALQRAVRTFLLGPLTDVANSVHDPHGPIAITIDVGREGAIMCQPDEDLKGGDHPKPAARLDTLPPPRPSVRKGVANPTAKNMRGTRCLPTDTTTTTAMTTVTAPVTAIAQA